MNRESKNESKRIKIEMAGVVPEAGVVGGRVEGSVDGGKDELSVGPVGGATVEGTVTGSEEPPAGVVIAGVVGGSVDPGGTSAVSQVDGRSPAKLLQTTYKRYFDASAL